mmetsp:Transcript_1845/g.1756  ORF Transcript_1845/g.1756 Transcript_1845/m.1756 type:complete len:147 (-) Transcript_1845:270-710(-)|eukprot:CAMPEP_0197840374 /NCGR_PEP_ID=MMETSP1437-20131217/45571_1 /TAXON_ID=49252 ORGANISM="Eucampia antarctica, Strain CCMP1452" /NCGR_SAMPLE_ID=MMETSP1437 /ASSEMBLY_ACC=CAM_ASM_001096 /LENGTH=146 /DNA_ID=CAMNT_0043449979 /DNA_START=270 /DNA_END=710 /DNA_ORIENTATION=+
MHQRRSGSSNSAPITPSHQNTNGHFSKMQGSNGYDPERGGMSASEMNANIMEEQNNDRIDELSEQVARLKGLTINIGNEVREQNSFLDNMQDGFANTGDLLAGSLRRIGSMLESGGAKHMCYMVAFVVFVMIFLYWIMTYKGQSGA